MSKELPRLSHITSIRLSDAEDSTASFGIERPLTCDEASQLLRVHPKTIKRLAARGEMPGHFRFGRWFFYPSELDSWMRVEVNSSGHSCR